MKTAEDTAQTWVIHFYYNDFFVRLHLWQLSYLLWQGFHPDRFYFRLFDQIDFLEHIYKTGQKMLNPKHKQNTNEVTHFLSTSSSTWNRQIHVPAAFVVFAVSVDQSFEQIVAVAGIETEIGPAVVAENHAFVPAVESCFVVENSAVENWSFLWGWCWRWSLCCSLVRTYLSCNWIGR